MTRILLPGRIAGMSSLSSSPPEGSGERWRFLRLDRAIDQLHSGTKEKGDRVRDVVAGATDKLRVKIGTLQTEQEQKVEASIEKEHEGDG